MGIHFLLDLGLDLDLDLLIARLDDLELDLIMGCIFYECACNPITSNLVLYNFVSDRKSWLASLA